MICCCALAGTKTCENCRNNKLYSFNNDLNEINYLTTTNFDYLENLKEAGKKLKEILNITEENINKACKEARKECW